MKRSFIIGFSTLALVLAAPIGHAAFFSQGFFGGSAIAQNAQRPDVRLQLVAEKRLVARNSQGQEQVTWQAIGGQNSARPGDVLRYSLIGNNQGNRAARKFALTQPVPKGTVYVMNSAAKGKGAELIYSIDGGKSFVANPTVPVRTASGKVENRPAPAESYTHIRWQWGGELAPGGNVNVAYQVRVR